MSASARQRVLTALQDGPKTTAELCQPELGGERFGARVMELRSEGHKIDSRRLREGCWLYEYVGHNGAAPASFVPKPASLPSTPAEILADLELRRFHVCDACSFSWRDRFWIEGCPSCRAGAWWIASHYTRDAARTHVPLTPPAVESVAVAA